MLKFYIGRMKGVVSSYQIKLILPSVAENHPKIYPSQCNLLFSICRHARGNIVSLKNHHRLFKDILFPPFASHGPMEFHLLLIISYSSQVLDFQKQSYANSYEAKGLNIWILIFFGRIKTLQNQNRVLTYRCVIFNMGDISYRTNCSIILQNNPPI